MAFPVPKHLPRKHLPKDVSSKILSKISDTNYKSLSSELAAEWVTELELNIQQTKNRIYERIYQGLPDFERQLESSKLVQTRLQDLTSNVDKLSDALNSPETGLLPPLLKALQAHKELTQRAEDAQVTYEALSYLNECRSYFEKLTALVDDGQLAEGVRRVRELGTLLEGAPEALARADVMADMREQLRILKDRIEEQLSEACSRSIRISSTELRISPSVQVRQAQTIITLQDILGSLSSLSLDAFLASLRRDTITYFIDFPLQQPCSSNISRTSDSDGAPSICFSIFPLPPSSNSKVTTPGYLRSLYDFLRESLFSALPPSVQTSLPRSLCKPTTTALLNNVLIPCLPSSLSELPTFLELVKEAAEFEREYLFKGETGPNSNPGDGEVRSWARGVASHYGRKRRIDLLADARELILTRVDGQTVRVEVSEPREAAIMAPVPEVIPVQGVSSDEGEAGWDFEEETHSRHADVTTNGGPSNEEVKPSARHTEEDANGWDFDDRDAAAPDQTKVEDNAQDDSDAWGWGDEEETSTPATSESGNAGKSDHAANEHQVEEPKQQDSSEDSVWDTAWDEPEPAPPSPPIPASPVKVPKVAKGLEKLTAKGKRKGSTSPAPSNPPSSTFSSSPKLPSSTSPNPQTRSSPQPQVASSSTLSTHRSPQATSNPQNAGIKPPSLSLAQKPKELETCLISSRVQGLIRLISDVLSESRAIASSSIFSDFPLSPPDSASNASTLVLQAAPATLDLYRAVYPVVFAAELSRSARAFRFSNDCMYMHEKVAKLDHLPAGSASAVHEQMSEALKRLHALGTWWFDEGIERECKQILHVLSGAEGFVELGDQERFDECEAVMSEVLQNVRAVTAEWKSILPRTKWLRSTGRVVETALTRVLDDVLALPDIPEVESRRLGELCRILSALESLFIDTSNPEAPSVVLDYVPSWLKYSYLSELLEASIADISYLFDEGALIDFSVDELVRLVRALFADTPLRTNTIAKLQRGHPVPVG